jgi:curved DNA-binding protein CbpA
MANSIVDNYYEILKIPSHSTSQEIKCAYDKLAHCYGPENRITPSDYAKKEYIRCQDAYNILSNPKSRAIYDKLLLCECKLLDTSKKYIIAKDTSSILGIVSVLTLSILGIQISYSIVKYVIVSTVAAITAVMSLSLP